tara:strand:- start:358 stop:792 length:435 start_codon:yes stop_codon:yes gene_type:complete
MPVTIDVDKYSKDMQGNIRRAAEINRYYDLKYAEYKSIAFEIMVGLVLLIILNLLGEFLPDSIYKYIDYINIVISVLLIVRLVMRLFDISRRTSRFFDEYEFGHPSKYDDYNLAIPAAQEQQYVDVNSNDLGLNADTISTYNIY